MTSHGRQATRSTFGNMNNQSSLCSLLVQTIVASTRVQHCRVCGDPGHRTKECPSIQSDEDLPVHMLDAIDMDGISEASLQRKLRPAEVKGTILAPKASPRRRGGGVSSAWMEVPETRAPEEYRMDAGSELYISRRRRRRRS